MTRASVVQNPFNITKATDFSDQEIAEYWVDLGSRGFERLAKPTSAMPMFIVGGKGSGKTHLMRYFSYNLQRIRSAKPPKETVISDAFVGIYLRCGGLNSARFSGKGINSDAWADLFAYYSDLWLAQLVIETMISVFDSDPELRPIEQKICTEIVGLFDKRWIDKPQTLAQLISGIQQRRRELDIAINNCALTQRIDIEIGATRGKLVFGAPAIFIKNLRSLRKVRVLYLVDEFENLSIDQQKYVNTLIREKTGPCSFKIGSRLYGVRTHDNYSQDEANKEGAEFEVLRLDQRLRDNKKYHEFSRALIQKRLHQSGITSAKAEKLAEYFESVDTQGLMEKETQFVIEKYRNVERPYFRALRQKLLKHEKNSGGVAFAPEDVDEILKDLSRPELPIIEKANVFLFYKAWALRADLAKAAKDIGRSSGRFLQSKSKAAAYSRTMHHFKADLFAQLLRECDQKQRYVGLEVLIDMSWGLPRYLLLILKHVYAWAVFGGETPFQGRPISIKAQQSGVLEASDAFYREMRMMGSRGSEVADSIDKLGTLFRNIRFSDKPSECSLTAFSFNQTGVSSRAADVIGESTRWSLLIEVGKQRDRNTGSVDAKLQLNRMMAPRWDLPLFRRGVISLSSNEINAIFDVTNAASFPDCEKLRISRMTAPLFGRQLKPKGAGNVSVESKTDILPGFEDV